MLISATLILLLASATQDLQDPRATWAQAEIAFRDGVDRQGRGESARASFARAAHLFADLERQGMASAALYLNLGRAHYQAGALPEAILAFRRGLETDPADRRLRDGLRHSRGDVVHPRASEIASLLEAETEWAARLTPMRLGVVLLVSLLFVGAVLPAGLRRRRWLAVGLGGLSLGLALGTLFVQGHVAGRIEFDRAHPVHVVRDDVALRTGNGVSYDPHPEFPELPRGLEVRVLHARGAWRRVVVAGGRTGWVPAEKLTGADGSSAAR